MILCKTNNDTLEDSRGIHLRMQVGHFFLHVSMQDWLEVKTLVDNHQEGPGLHWVWVAPMSTVACLWWNCLRESFHSNL